VASPQTENGFIKIANELYNEILRRNFSKRQQNIILFIWRLSYGCGKKDCIISKFNYFELAGVDKSDIKTELEFLSDCHVIEWNKESATFGINKNFDYWQITPNKKWNKNKFAELLAENIQHKKKLVNYQQENNSSLQNTNYDVGKLQTMELVN